MLIKILIKYKCHYILKDRWTICNNNFVIYSETVRTIISIIFTITILYLQFDAVCNYLYSDYIVTIIRGVFTVDDRNEIVLIYFYIK